MLQLLMEFSMKKSVLFLLQQQEKKTALQKDVYHLLGASAITHYKVLKEYDNYSFVNFSLETGRTHQIRVHSTYIGHPISGDTLYGHTSPYISRQALHCNKLSFIHPISHKKMCIEAPLPKDMADFLKAIERFPPNLRLK